MNGSRGAGRLIWEEGWELDPRDPPWAGLSRGARLFSNPLPWLIAAAVVVVYFTIDHGWYASLNIGRAGRDLGSDLAFVGEGSTRLGKLLSYALLGLLGLVLVLRRARHRLAVRGPLSVCILVLLGWAAVSLLWSADPEITVRRGGVLLLMTVLAVGLVRQLSPREIAAVISAVSATFLFLGIAAEVVLGSFQPLSEGYRFAGTLHPNHQAANCALALLGGLWFGTSKNERWSRRWLGLAVAALALTFMFFTRSRSGFMAGTAAAAVLLLLRLPKRYGVLIPVAATGTAAGMALLFLTERAETPWSVLLLGRSVEQVATLNSRVPLWRAMLEFVGERPVLGFGYGAFVDPERGAAIAAEVGGFVLGGPHSAYMSVLLDLGVVGLLLFLAVLVLGVITAVRRFRLEALEGQAFMAATLLFYALNGLLAAHMVYPTISLWLVLLLVAIGFSVGGSEVKATGAGVRLPFGR